MPIVMEGIDSSAELRIHESNMGLPLCGTPVRPWHGNTMLLKEMGPRQVTCLRCPKVKR